MQDTLQLELQGESPLGSGTCSVLFLDVDGVLNRCGKSNQWLETDKCDILAYICRMTVCKVVVSSTWRKYPHLMAERLLPMFRSRGIECIGQTPVMVSERKLLDQSMLYTAKPRHMEISAWLADHPEVTQYAIVDDDRDADDGTGRYVRTDSYEGLLDSHATAIMRLLSPLNDPSLATRGLESAPENHAGDGRVMEEVPAREDVSIGQIAGWPSAEQYEAAANKALERAKAIRERANDQIQPASEP